MTYAHNKFSNDEPYEEQENEQRRASYTRGRSYLSERRRRARRRTGNLSINGRRQRRWMW